MPAPRRVALIALLLALLVGLAWREASYDERPRTEPERPAPAGMSPEELTGLPLEPSATPGAVVPRFDANGEPAPPAPLPHISELVAQANSGNARAACQLAAELQLCREQAVMARSQTAPAGGRATERCAALLERHVGQHFNWLRQAAFAGEPEAMLRYALGEGFGMPGESHAYLRSPDFDTWRREAPAMLQTLFEAGYPEVLVFLMVSPDPLMGGQLHKLLPPDPVRERAYVELLAKLVDDGAEAASLAALLARPEDPAVRDQARALATQWHAAHFPIVRLPVRTGDDGHRLPMMHASGQACSQVAPGAAP
ncbi:hypothetical protein [Arenimonas sp. SCN 70-307]|uniref:hypothetical protein n=1 Tax=Arenimonas sp. SCN 70-307 TaxID=1660089 RepID=UPI0025B7C75C|nr:hypothetical protein [Arenimonas sp. SCN 70-307]